MPRVRLLLSSKFCCSRARMSDGNISHSSNSNTRLGKYNASPLMSNQRTNLHHSFSERFCSCQRRLEEASHKIPSAASRISCSFLKRFGALSVPCVSAGAISILSVSCEYPWLESACMRCHLDFVLSLQLLQSKPLVAYNSDIRKKRCHEIVTVLLCRFSTTHCLGTLAVSAAAPGGDSSHVAPSTMTIR